MSRTTKAQLTELLNECMNSRDSLRKELDVTKDKLDFLTKYSSAGNIASMAIAMERISIALSETIRHIDVADEKRRR